MPFRRLQEQRLTVLPIIYIHDLTQINLIQKTRRSKSLALFHLNREKSTSVDRSDRTRIRSSLLVVR